MSEPASIAEVIAAEGGEVTFARFMELALTHPTLGYYSRADRLLRHGGDFSTAPALSPFFCRTLARLVTELVDAALGAEAGASAGRRGDDRPSVVELGGGEGHLAAAMLELWDEERPELRDTVAYRAVEVGPGLRARQAGALDAPAVRGWDVGWGATLAEACAGTRPVVMVGNEFLDTLPVHLVGVAEAGLTEAYVRSTWTGSLEQTWGPVSEAAAEELEGLFGTLDPACLVPLSSDGVIEVRPGLATLLRQVALLMSAGSLVNIDYGAWLPGVSTDGEGWGPEDRVLRNRTVRGYFKHQMVLDPLVRPGRQDLTSDVDFAALDLHGRRQGFETVLFTTMAAFLAAGGAETELQARMVGSAGSDFLEDDRQATVLRGLLDGSDLGGAFKLIVQVRE